MYRNDSVVPFFSLGLSEVFFIMAYLDRSRIIAYSGTTPDALSSGQIGLIAFGMTLFIYGVIGLVSVWLEGSELRPTKRQPEAGLAPVVVGVVLSILLALLSGFFVRIIVYELNTGPGPVNTLLEGGVFGLMMAIIAALLVLYKKYFMEEEVLAEDEHSEVPW